MADFIPVFMANIRIKIGDLIIVYRFPPSISSAVPSAHSPSTILVRSQTNAFRAFFLSSPPPSNEKLAPRQPSLSAGAGSASSAPSASTAPRPHQHPAHPPRPPPPKSPPPPSALSSAAKSAQKRINVVVPPLKAPTRNAWGNGPLQHTPSPPAGIARHGSAPARGNGPAPSVTPTSTSFVTRPVSKASEASVAAAPLPTATPKPAATSSSTLTLAPLPTSPPTLTPTPPRKATPPRTATSPRTSIPTTTPSFTPTSAPAQKPFFTSAQHSELKANRTPSPSSSSSPVSAQASTPSPQRKPPLNFWEARIAARSAHASSPTTATTSSSPAPPAAVRPVPRPKQQPEAVAAKSSVRPSVSGSPGTVPTKAPEVAALAVTPDAFPKAQASSPSRAPRAKEVSPASSPLKLSSAASDSSASSASSKRNPSSSSASSPVAKQFSAPWTTNDPAALAVKSPPKSAKIVSNSPVAHTATSTAAPSTSAKSLSVDRALQDPQSHGASPPLPSSSAPTNAPQIPNPQQQPAVSVSAPGPATAPKASADSNVSPAALSVDKLATTQRIVMEESPSSSVATSNIPVTAESAPDTGTETLLVFGAHSTADWEKLLAAPSSAASSAIHTIGDTEKAPLAAVDALTAHHFLASTSTSAKSSVAVPVPSPDATASSANPAPASPAPRASSLAPATLSPDLADARSAPPTSSPVPSAASPAPDASLSTALTATAAATLTPVALAASKSVEQKNSSVSSAESDTSPVPSHVGPKTKAQISAPDPGSLPAPPISWANKVRNAQAQKGNVWEKEAAAGAGGATSPVKRGNGVLLTRSAPRQPAGAVSSMNGKLGASNGGGDQTLKGPPVRRPRVKSKERKQTLAAVLEARLRKLPTGRAGVVVPARGLLNGGNTCFVNVVLQALLACIPFRRMLGEVGSACGGTAAPTLLARFMRLMEEMEGGPGGGALPVSGFAGGIVEGGRQEDASEFLTYLLDHVHEELVGKKVVEGGGGGGWVAKPGEKTLSEKLREQAGVVNGGAATNGRTGVGSANSDLNGGTLAGRIGKVNGYQGSYGHGNGNLNGTGAKIAGFTDSESEEEEENKDVVGDVDDDMWEEMTGKGKSVKVRSSDLPQSPIIDIFGGVFRTELKRPNVKSSVKREPFLSLSLDVESGFVRDIEESLVAYFEPEVLEGYTLESSSETVDARIHVQLEQLPKVLILHLKRFSHNTVTGVFSKVTRRMNYPEFLEIPAKLLASTSVAPSVTDRMYRLTSVVTHVGKEIAGGHFTCDVRRSGGVGDEALWTYCDDSKVSPTSAQEVLKKQAYILFYSLDESG